ncbi:protein asteroid-like [Homarus americanus]|uniref:Asteroid-like n=1 Tax=Homarus americanus TaxID=6706 RepID=A0A8J5JT63_HOMAM|nr:protein asteroid-like [Homarus americanus]XP_042237124.1 protein asteroid-like [Homarus americanus]XP_042237125.1 protein asteroid-like [Homarus americanus]KAG7160574.1 asteroid-like [Homarus americanus]
MGIRGLSTYIHEHLSDVLERHKLHHCRIIIDGNNLAHTLYYECTGINCVFGGDYDKYASYVEQFFQRLQSCAVDTIVIMDGGQPLDAKKMRTVRERIQNQIFMCISVEPSNQMNSKLFPCMGRQVFVTTLHKMGIMVLQTDFEADEEIAMLSKKFGFEVLSNDSDFYMCDVPFILLQTVNHKKICTEKTKNSTKTFNYMTCRHFSVERFCELTGMDRAHLPLLATLLGNDYLAFDVFTDFYAHFDAGGKKHKYMKPRNVIIKNVISWLASQKGRSTEDVIQKVVTLANRKKLKRKIQDSVNHYTDMKTNLLSFISLDSCVKSTTEELGEPKSFLYNNDSQFLSCLLETKTLTKNSEIETDLVLKDGSKLPNWFMEAYRKNRIPHEVADILTQSYFISPPQVEERCSDCSYLVVESIVKSIYTMLWHSVCSHHLNSHDKDANMVKGKGVQGKLQYISSTGDYGQTGERDDHYASNVMYDSDVVVEEDEEESGEDPVNSELEEMPQLEEHHQRMGEEEVSDEEVPETAEDLKLDEMCEEDDDDTEFMVSGREIRTRTYGLKWYMRKGNKLWIKTLSHLPKKKARALPSLSEVGSMSASEKKQVFYSMLGSGTEFMDLDMPGDLELILDFIIYWFRSSKLPLKDHHALAVLMCVFMFYIIDGKMGRVRTKKEFEEIEKCKVKVSDLLSDATYHNPHASVKDLLVHISHEECLVAGYNLFKFHHMDQKINNKYYSRKTVHAFSEYQACIYFMQLLNSLLCSPFPMLSVECLWGGTFCYNIFHELKKKKSNPLVKITNFLGRGTCLERLFLKLFKRLGVVLNLQKCTSMVEFVENMKVPKKKYKETNSNTEKEAVEDTKIIEREKCQNLTDGKDTSTELSGRNKVKDTCKELLQTKRNKEELCRLVNNRFAELVLDTDSDSDG